MNLFKAEGRWHEEILKHQVMVMTAQIFLNLLNHGLISIRKTNVLIFDECHHARKNHPYREIMRHYLECSEGLNFAKFLLFLFCFFFLVSFHARQNLPYREIMRHYLECPEGLNFPFFCQLV